MNTNYKSIFYTQMKEIFNPVLRDLGYKGSGQNFRRISGDVIHTINIQANTHGGSCRINLGLHLTFLPLSWSNDHIQDPKKIKEVDCEFRDRLIPKGKGDDYWWRYDGGGPFCKASESVHSIIETYKNVGEPLFQKFGTLDKVAQMFTLSELKEENFKNCFGNITPARGALTMARIYNHLGEVDQASKFAEYGISILGCALALKPELEKLLKKT